MFQKGEVIVYNRKEYIILDINYNTRMVTIGIPNSNNVTHKKTTINWSKISHQS